MYSIRQTVALFLLALGGLLILLGAMGPFIKPPSDVSPEVTRQVTTLFLVGGVIGLGLFAWGVYLRATLSRGGKWFLWGLYLVVLVVFIGLIAFVWEEVQPIIGSIAAERNVGGMVVAGVFFLMFLFGPIILFFQKRLTPSGDKSKGSGEGREKAESD